MPGDAAQEVKKYENYSQFETENAQLDDGLVYKYRGTDGFSLKPRDIYTRKLRLDNTWARR
jgi:hypothetical protein